MMELLANKSDNPSECVRIWIKEIESCGFGSFFYESEALNTNVNKNVANDNDEDGFIAQDPFCKKIEQFPLTPALESKPSSRSYLTTSDSSISQKGS